MKGIECIDCRHSVFVSSDPLDPKSFARHICSRYGVDRVRDSFRPTRLPECENGEAKVSNYEK
jgi:hypothetical protein